MLHYISNSFATLLLSLPESDFVLQNTKQIRSAFSHITYKHSGADPEMYYKEVIGTDYIEKCLTFSQARTGRSYVGLEVYKY